MDLGSTMGTDNNTYANIQQSVHVSMLVFIGFAEAFCFHESECVYARSTIEWSKSVPYKQVSKLVLQSTATTEQRTIRGVEQNPLLGIQS